MFLKKIQWGVKDKLPKSNFTRGVSFLVGGNFSSIFATLIASPFLTRLYSPEDFASLAIYISCVALINVISGLRYELAIPIADDDKDAINLTFLSLIINILITLILSFFVALFLVLKTSISLSYEFYFLLLLGVFSGGIYKTIRFWAIRNKKFSDIASNRVKQIFITILIQLVSYKFGGFGLIIGNLSGFLFAVFSLTKSIYYLFDFQMVSKENISGVASIYKRFPLYSTFSGLSSTAGLRLPPILFSYFFGPISTGYYALSDRIMTLPMSLIGSSVAQVFRIHGMDAKNDGYLSQLVKKLHFILSQFSFPIASLVLLAGPDLFEIIFGNKWRQSGVLASILSPWIYLVLITSPLSSLFGINKEEKKSFKFQLLTLIARLFAIFIGVKSGNFVNTIILFSAVGVLTRIYLLYILVKPYYKNIYLIIEPTIKAILPTFLTLFPLIFYYLGFRPFSDNYFIICLFISITLITFRIYSLRNLLQKL